MIVVVVHPKTKRTYEVYFMDGYPRAVSRKTTPNGRSIDLWWHTKGPVSRQVQEIINMAIVTRDRLK